MHAAVAIATWSVHVGALFLVGALASVVTGELRRTGAELNRSSSDHRRLRDLNAHIVRSLNSGLLTTDLNGLVGSFNPEAERITGMRATEALGVHVDEVIPRAWQLMTAPAGEGLEPVRRTRLDFVSRCEASLFLGLASSALRDGRGEPVGQVLSFQDVTHVVALETELTQRARLAAVGEMAARIAHEIRNPLAAISGSVQLLQHGEGHASSDDPDRLIGIVVREADRLSGLITDFLGYARLQPIRRELVLLDELVHEVVEVMRGGAPREVALEFRADGPVEVVGDPVQLRQVLWNLCLNGIEAMPRGGTLCVTVQDVAAPPQGLGVSIREGESATDVRGRTRVARCAEVVVEDEGNGIEPELLDRLFEPFFTTKPQGTGLGLATVHRIVEAHGGELEVESTPGSGTRFRLRLERGKEGIGGA